jgi:sugar lactone lactonase YvrE
LSRNLSRRELIVRGAIGGAALALPLPEALAAVRNRPPRDSVHCLAASDRFTPTEIFTDCTFASFAPSGERVALASPRGIEILDRANDTRVAVTPPGFTLTGHAWHPGGDVLIASGPAADGTGRHLHAVTAAGVTRLLPDHPGAARAACFSPDGRKVAFTYLNRFQHQLCMADWTGTALAKPVNLLPVDPAAAGSVDRVMASLAWYETRCFSPDGRRLYFASDRGAGMLNVSVQYIELATAKRRRVNYDEGVSEGAVLAPDNAVLYSATTRAREPGFLTMVSGPAVPAFLGFVAEPTLHQQLAERRLATIGNGDVIAMDPTYGLRARVVGGRKPLSKKLNAPVPGGSYRVAVCSMSGDAEDLAVAMTSALGSNVVVLHRPARSVPAPVAVGATPAPRGAVPLSPQPLRAVDRTIVSQRGGRVVLKLDGDLTQGSFSVAFENFSPDGVLVFAGTAAFETGGGGFRHAADVRRVGLESQEEVNVFYRADMQVGWSGGPTSDPPGTSGTIESVSRSGNVAAAWDGAVFAPQDGWDAGDRGPRPVPGTRKCRRARRS